ncbi:MAG: glutamate--tRNA ligase [Candidatus Sericytochromatia bacterium]|nr:glutamate--tRNA ligase [Candidatus Sericytochromatia bacterium]
MTNGDDAVWLLGSLVIRHIGHIFGPLSLLEFGCNGIPEASYLAARVRVRFAPSPTGYLHVGGARTALFNWLFARKHGGDFVLRVEDTDQARSTDESVAAIFDGLRWLDLKWDEGPEAAQTYGPYFQTQRLSLYRAYAERLMASGRAYRCYLTAEELHAHREAQKVRGEEPRFDRRWSDLDDATRAQYEQEGRPFVTRFRGPDAGEIVVEDALRGTVTFDAAQMVEDFVLLKSDGIPTYNYAAVIDDLEMGITHVIRGDDHLSNTPKQIAVYQALGASVPVFCHLPMILGADKSKLSKRHGTTSVMKFADDGFLPEALVNYLARLGWSYGDQEYFTRDELIEKFSLEGLNKSAAVFDFAKLEAMNAHYIQHANTARLLPDMQARWEKAGMPYTECAEAWQLAVISSLQVRSRTLVQMLEGSLPFFDLPLNYDEDAVRVHLGPESIGLLDSLRQALRSIDDWSEAVLEASIKSLAKEQGVKLGALIQPARVALTGRSASPGIYEVLVLLGPSLTFRRLDEAVSGRICVDA